MVSVQYRTCVPSMKVGCENFERKLVNELIVNVVMSDAQSIVMHNKSDPQSIQLPRDNNIGGKEVVIVDLARL